MLWLPARTHLGGGRTRARETSVGIEYDEVCNDNGRSNGWEGSRRLISGRAAHPSARRRRPARTHAQSQAMHPAARELQGHVLMSGACAKPVQLGVWYVTIVTNSVNLMAAARAQVTGARGGVRCKASGVTATRSHETTWVATASVTCGGAGTQFLVHDGLASVATTPASSAAASTIDASAAGLLPMACMVPARRTRRGCCRG